MLYQLFIEFLQEHNYIDLFFKECYRIKPDIFENENLLNEAEDKNYFLDMFDWGDTKQGHELWSIVSKQWDKYYANNNWRLNSDTGNLKDKSEVH